MYSYIFIEVPYMHWTWAPSSVIYFMIWVIRSFLIDRVFLYFHSVPRRHQGDEVDRNARHHFWFSDTLPEDLLSRLNSRLALLREDNFSLWPTFTYKSCIIPCTNEVKKIIPMQVVSIWWMCGKRWGGTTLVREKAIPPRNPERDMTNWSL